MRVIEKRINIETGWANYTITIPAYEISNLFSAFHYAIKYLENRRKVIEKEGEKDSYKCLEQLIALRKEWELLEKDIKDTFDAL